MRQSKTNLANEKHLVKFSTGQSAVTISEMVEAVAGAKDPKASLLALERACENARILLWEEFQLKLKAEVDLKMSLTAKEKRQIYKKTNGGKA